MAEILVQALAFVLAQQDGEPVRAGFFRGAGEGGDADSVKDAGGVVGEGVVEAGVVVPVGGEAGGVFPGEFGGQEVFAEAPGRAGGVGFGVFVADVAAAKIGPAGGGEPPTGSGEGYLRLSFIYLPYFSPLF